MSKKRIRLTPVGAAVSFTEISPSKRQRRRKCKRLLEISTRPGGEEPSGGPGSPLSLETGPDVFSDLASDSASRSGTELFKASGVIV